jgi:hypothetical protein
MTDVCREFGISRKTGCKIFDRYKEHGLEGAKRSLGRSAHHFDVGRETHEEDTPRNRRSF